MEVIWSPLRQPVSGACDSGGKSSSLAQCYFFYHRLGKPLDVFVGDGGAGFRSYPWLCFLINFRCFSLLCQSEFSFFYFFLFIYIQYSGKRCNKFFSPILVGILKWFHYSELNLIWVYAETILGFPESEIILGQKAISVHYIFPMQVGPTEQK